MKQGCTFTFASHPFQDLYFTMETLRIAVRLSHRNCNVNLRRHQRDFLDAAWLGASLYQGQEGLHQASSAGTWGQSLLIFKAMVQDAHTYSRWQLAVALSQFSHLFFTRCNWTLQSTQTERCCCVCLAQITTGGSGYRARLRAWTYPALLHARQFFSVGLFSYEREPTPQGTVQWSCGPIAVWFHIGHCPGVPAAQLRPVWDASGPLLQTNRSPCSLEIVMERVYHVVDSKYVQMFCLQGLCQIYSHHKGDKGWLGVMDTVMI